ncbi:MAG TPA: cysteine desulfurase [Candidatus Limivivens merdigallinarum]|uniref:cysteine desulfurase n=1 Tax=Candidatus Limivivens merdigallinarum TaxID=2840859 RepID=A0A9D0ZW07_9FIRM|nr:cysteine desulfurase [Candidatus Limivivens merdigallinarum]
MEAYFDNSATTRCLDPVVDIVVKTMKEDYGNPSSRHGKGMEAEQYLRKSREIIAKTLKVKEKEIFFTSGGTESNNWAIIETALANQRAGKHVVTTAVEHAAVIQPMMYLKELGFEVTFLPVDGTGRISLEELENALREDTILVSMMYVNNELGTREPVEEAAALVKKKCPKALFHTDAIQAYGKYQIYPKKIGVDLLSVSGHKIHGPKGVGFLYVDEKAKIRPLILGGGQQKGMRSGTDNVPGIAGLGVAAEAAYQDFAAKQALLRSLKEYFSEKVATLPDTRINGPLGELGAPHIVSVGFAGVRSEVLLHALEERGIYVSSGSACSSNKTLPVSTVLREIHLDSKYLDSTVRFSFCTQNTKEEIDYCMDTLRELLPVLRRYTRH